MRNTRPSSFLSLWGSTEGSVFLQEESILQTRQGHLAVISKCSWIKGGHLQVWYRIWTVFPGEKLAHVPWCYTFIIFVSFTRLELPALSPFMNLFGLPRLKAQDLLKGPKNHIEFMLFTFNSHLLRISSTITWGLSSVMCHYPWSDHQSYVSEKNYTLNWKTSP